MKPILLLLLMLFSSPLWAIFMMPQLVPLDSMMQDLEAKAKAEPENPEWIYRQGRVAYLGMDLGRSAAPAYRPDQPGESLPGEPHLPSDPSFFDHRAPQGWEIDVLNVSERQALAEKALVNLTEARKRSPDTALYALTYASFVRRWLELEELHAEAPASLQELNLAVARTAFKEAWMKGREADLAREHQPVEGRRALISGEAARAWLALEEDSKPDAATARKMKKDLKALETLPMGPITPIVFHPLQQERKTAPIDEEARVAFDLAGNGSGGIWPWIEEGAAFLVWDPLLQGRIRSGSQMFGDYSWEMPWKHGFEALATLDRNKDGWLRGAELDGLSAWFDRHPLGSCDPGEVVSLQRLGVRAIALEAQTHADGNVVAWHPQGLHYDDGRKMPLWDWVTEALQP